MFGSIVGDLSACECNRLENTSTKSFSTVNFKSVKLHCYITLVVFLIHIPTSVWPDHSGIDRTASESGSNSTPSAKWQRHPGHPLGLGIRVRNHPSKGRMSRVSANSMGSRKQKQTTALMILRMSQVSAANPDAGVHQPAPRQ